MFDPREIVKLEELRRLERLQRDYALFAYAPHSKQEIFHRNGDKKRRYLRTGNRFGKSTCGSAEDAAFAIGERPWMEKDDPDRFKGIPQRPTKGLILVADWDKAREIFTSMEEGQRGKLIQWIPVDRLLPPKKNQSGEIDCIPVKSIWGGTSLIYIDTVASFKHNPLSQESSQWDWIHVDEPIPKEMWIAAGRGLIDTGGSAWFTCTPITEQWINEYFLPPSKMRKSFEFGEVHDDYPERWVMTGSTYDNLTLDKENVDMFANSLDPKERQARIYGIPKASTGLVYGNFEMERHVYSDLPIGWKDFDEPPEDYTIRVVIDTHVRTEQTAQFWATAPTGEKFCWSEIFADCYINTFCEAILETLKGRTPHLCVIDQSAFIPNPIDGRCLADVFWEYGIPVQRATKELKTGIIKARQALEATRTYILAGREVTLGLVRFCSSCTETIREFFLYTWQKEKEKPIDKDDHMMECFYRAVSHGLQWVDPASEPLSETPSTASDRELDLTPFADGDLNSFSQ